MIMGIIIMIMLKAKLTKKMFSLVMVRVTLLLRKGARMARLVKIPITMITE